MVIFPEIFARLPEGKSYEVGYCGKPCGMLLKIGGAAPSSGWWSAARLGFGGMA